MQFEPNTSSTNSSAEVLDPDSSIRSTDLDALVSRHSASLHSLLVDPYSVNFLPASLRRNPPNRPPLINIGTHARTWSVDHLVESFINRGRDEKGKGKGRECQVLSLGAGTDCRYWRMRDLVEGRGEGWNVINWVELDFPQATATKARTITTKNDLLNGLKGNHRIEKGGTSLVSPSYAILPTDLRSFATFAPTLLAPSSTSPDSPPHLSSTLPTLLLAECVFIYLPPSSVTDILQWFSKTFESAGGMHVAYDPFGLGDNFGKVMIRNLATRNLSLPSASSTPSLSSLSTRLLSAGFNLAYNLSLREIRDSVIPIDEIARVNGIEQLDEVEELNLVLEHYAISYGFVGDTETVTRESMDTIGLIPRT